MGGWGGGRRLSFHTTKFHPIIPEFWSLKSFNIAPQISTNLASRNSASSCFVYVRHTNPLFHRHQGGARPRGTCRHTRLRPQEPVSKLSIQMEQRQVKRPYPNGVNITQKWSTLPARWRIVCSDAPPLVPRSLSPKAPGQSPPISGYVWGRPQLALSLIWTKNCVAPQ